MSLAINRILVNQYFSRNKVTFALALMVLFLVMFDNLVQYISPLLIAQQGYTMTIIGLIIGSSSLAGAGFDFLIAKFIRNTDFRRIFLFIFVICLIFPLLLAEAKTIWFWLIVMAVWGVYFDLLDFGIFDYVGRHTPPENHSDSFGLIQIFKALAGILSPLIVGLVVYQAVDWRAFILAWVFWGIALVFFIALVLLYNRRPLTIDPLKHLKRRTIWQEWNLWRIILRKLLPILTVTFFLFILDAFFWVLAPLYSDKLGLQHFGGLFLSAYALPILLLGWFVGPITGKFGKKRTAFFSLLLGSLVLSTFAYLGTVTAMVLVVFLASCFTSLAMPSINGVYADYISEAPMIEGEIEGLENFAFNLGYFFGPILSGLLADIFDIGSAFSILGLCGIVLSLILIAKTPRSIDIKIKASDLR